MQRELKIGSAWTPVERRANHSVMTYEIRVMCDEHYYGSGCANLCRPRDDNFGHYTCSPSGNVQCLEGWKGDYCTKREYQNRSYYYFFNFTFFFIRVIDVIFVFLLSRCLCLCFCAFFGPFQRMKKDQSIFTLPLVALTCSTNTPPPRSFTRYMRKNERVAVVTYELLINDCRMINVLLYWKLIEEQGKGKPMIEMCYSKMKKVKKNASVKS